METGRLQPSHWSQGNVDTNFCKPVQIKELFGHTDRIYFPPCASHSPSHTQALSSGRKVYALAKCRACIWGYATKISPSNQLEKNNSYGLSGQVTVLFRVFNRIYPQQAFCGDHHWKSQVVIQCCAHRGQELEKLSPPAALGG